MSDKNTVTIPSEDYKKLLELEAAVEEARKTLDAHRRYLTARYAPVEEGDVIEVNDFSYRGKPMRVRDVSFSSRYGGRSFRAVGGLINKDGLPGSREGQSFFTLVEGD